ncbi:MAG: Crp/Fnr family transcriptional regulator [Dehalococcoidia bacterium]
MSDVATNEALGRISLFAGLTAPELAEIATKMRPQRFKRGEVIFYQGDAPGAFFLIRTGSVKITTMNADGKETLLALLTAGQCVGEMGALDGDARSATVTALEVTETLALQRPELLGFVRSHPDFALRLIATLASRLRRLDERLEDAHFLDLDTRLAKLLIDFARERGQRETRGIVVPMPLSQSDLAAMIGGTRVSVNRLLNAYQEEGILAREKDSFVIVHERAMRAHAGEEV